MVEGKEICPDLGFICQRVGKKRDDYLSYQFTQEQNDILKTFFDLAQEYDSLPDLYRICVAVPHVYLGLTTGLYLVNGVDDGLELVCDTKQGVYSDPLPAPATLTIAMEPYEYAGGYVVPIRRRHYSAENTPVGPMTSSCLGVLVISPVAELTAQGRFFFIKYTNRIAYNLHNRQLMQQNIRHLEFINNLVMDIEHNVIIPNMYFRHLFNQLRKSLGSLNELRQELAVPAARPNPVVLRERLLALQGELDSSHRQLLDHHATTSLFLESLFRRDHFREGHLVLRAKPCKVENQIIKPQLENYLNRLDHYGIKVEYPPDMGDEIPLFVDIGLLAQVYANLFSNVVKYTEEVRGQDGIPRKAVAYGREMLKDYFGAGKDGIKFNVFSTGRHLGVDELEKIFEDGYRGANSGRSPGTGHGLSFIKQVVEIHGGRVGCELVPGGNNFYFVLPFYSGGESLPA
ncbi:MAG: HAMP domain-containing histidine kinase [Desulfobulbaceae bacterium]|nr:HAMP domain-containing histidine kinase [Desulfobulbaceae bacterium]